MRFIVPGGVADDSQPSGGNTYDRRMSRALTATELAVHGTWPTPDPSARAALDETLAEIPDGAVVLIDGLVAAGVPDVVVPHTRRLRLAVLVHLPLADETGLPPALAADLNTRERETLRAAHAVVATSPWAMRRLVEHHGLAAERVHAVPPGTDPAPPARGTGDPIRLICVASVTPRKGQDLLAAALSEITELPWLCECVGPLRGDPDYAQRLRELIERFGITDRMVLAGPRSGADLDASYAAADLLVLPSRAETYGMVITEALARAIPVVAAAVDAVPETLGHVPDGRVPGILVPPENPAALADALRHFLTEPALRDRLRAAARDRVLEDWDTAATRMAAVLDRLRTEPLCAA